LKLWDVPKWVHEEVVERRGASSGPGGSSIIVRPMNISPVRAGRAKSAYGRAERDPLAGSGREYREAE